MGITWSSQAHVFPKLDDAGSTRTMIHRRTRRGQLVYKLRGSLEPTAHVGARQGCAVGSRDPRNLYTNCPLLSRPPVNHRSGTLIQRHLVGEKHGPGMTT